MKFLAFLAFGALVLAPAGAAWAQAQTDQQQPQQQPQQQQQQQPQASQGTQIESKSLVGSTVRGQDGRDVGKVSDVMIDPAQAQTDQQQPQQQQQQQPQASQGTQIESKSLVGSTVRGQDGRDVGKVSDVMIDPAQGRVSSVIISMGGTAGIGATEFTVPWNAIQVGREQQRIVVTLQQDALQQAPPRAEDRKKDQPGGQASPSTDQKK